MSKLKLISVIVILGCLTISLAYSQSFNIFKSNAPAAQKQEPEASQLSPEQFKSNVKELGKQTRDELQTQVKNSLASPPLSNNTAIEVTVPGHTTKEDKSQPQQVSAPQTTAAPVSQPQTPPQATKPALEAAPPPPTQSQPQSQPYTGFGTGGSTGGNQGGTAPSGGWNIKY